VVISSLLGAAGYGFVLKSLPYHTPQLLPPQVRVTAQDLAALSTYPGGVRGVPVLTWRDVSHRPGFLVTTPARFATELAVLRRDGFHSVRPAALAALAAGRHVALPARPVMLTFDGGLASDWTTVDPILRQYGFTGVVFIDPDDVALKSPSYFLTSEELSAMAASGRWDIGLQLADERVPMTAVERRAAGLPRVGRTELETLTEWSERTAVDAAAKQDELADITGRPVTAFAWPVALTQGISNLEAPQVLYPVLRRLFGVVFGRPASGAATFITPGSAGRPLPRLQITAATTLRALAENMRVGVPSPPPPAPLVLPWTADSGQCVRDNGTLRLRGRGFELCTADADGSQWRNYQLSLDLGFVKSADLTAIIELRLSTVGRIEIAIGSVGFSVKQLVGLHWRLLGTFTAPRPAAGRGATLSFLHTGALSATLRLTGSVLAIRVGGITARMKVSPAISHGVIAVGLVSPSRIETVTCSRLHISVGPVPTTAGSDGD
jgi:biofilm PGA synthesis lipoprotein PgaB